MPQKNFSDIIENHQGVSVFSMDKLWHDPEPVAQKYRLYLSPDSHFYSSRLNPIFSFELENLSSTTLRYFNLVSLRDGVYPLMRFFFMNPAALAGDPYLIIDSALAPLVPKAWEKNVFLRGLYESRPSITHDTEECIFLISPDKDSFHPSILQEELEKFSAKLKPFKKISLFFSSCRARGEEDVQFDSSTGYSTVMAISSFFPEKELAILDWATFSKKNVSDVYFLEINPLKFYFSDSFLPHILLQRGARRLQDSSPFRNGSHQEPLSAHHGYEVFSLEEIDRAPDFFDQDLLGVFNGQDINVKFSFNDYTSVKLTTPAFKTLCLDVARALRSRRS